MYDIIGKRRWFFTLSGILILLGILFRELNVSFLVGLAFAIGADWNKATETLYHTIKPGEWKRFTASRSRKLRESSPAAANRYFWVGSC